MSSGKVFLSYSDQDQAFVERLYKRLSADRVECFFDKESIAWGENWVVALEGGIDQAGHIVLVLTPDFCQSEWTKLERTSAMADDPSGLKRKLKPLLLKACDVPRFLKPIHAIRVTTEAEFEAAYPRICRDLGGDPAKEKLPTDRSKLPPRVRLPARHRMPYRSLGDRFVGRASDLWRVHDSLHDGKTTVVQSVGLVSGTGGVGKTQLAIEYVHRFAGSYPGGVFWVDADRGYSALVEQLSKAADIPIDGALELKDQADELWRILSQAEPSLVVLDNFPETGALENWLPRTGDIHTLVTTRRRDLTEYKLIALDFLDADSSLRLLNSGSRSFTKKETKPLIEALDGLPLALELTRHYLNLRPSLSVEALLVEWERAGQKEVLEAFARKYENQLPSGHEKDVAATFQLSLDAASDSARSVLQAMSLLAPKPVPRRLLRAILATPQGSHLADPLAEALSELAYKLSLIELDQESDPALHRLVLGFLTYAIPDSDKSIRSSVLDCLSDELKRVQDDEDTEAFREIEKIIPHIELWATNPGTPISRSIELCGHVGWHHNDWGRYREAEVWSREALRLAKQNCRDGSLVAKCKSNLMPILRKLGKLNEAEKLMREALESDQEQFGPEDPVVAIRQSNLALILQDKGKLDGARDLLQVALSIVRKSYDPGHPHVSRCRANLALVLEELGQLREAKELLEEALESEQSSFPPGHPNIAKTQSNLGLVMYKLGQFQSASDLLRGALASALDRFDAGHPTIALRQSSLASILYKLGKTQEACRLLERALDSNLKNFGPEHPKSAVLQFKLAHLMRDLGELERAHELLQHSYRTMLAKLGSEHTQTRMVSAELRRVGEALR